MMAVQLYWYLVAGLCLSSVFAYREKLLGGWEDIEPDRADVQDAAKLAVQKYNEQSDDVFYYKLIQVTSAQSQVVAGINYSLTVMLGRTYCPKIHSSGYGYSNGHPCDVENSAVTKVYKCRLVIYERPWQKGSEMLLSSSCA